MDFYTGDYKEDCEKHTVLMNRVMRGAIQYNKVQHEDKEKITTA